MGVNPLTGRPGPAPHPPRDGDKVQSRQRVNVEVREGRRPHPNDLPCVDCGHKGDDRRHEYDHHLGYAAEHHYHVQPVCTLCHAARDSSKSKQTHCKRGHEYTVENTIIKVNGTRWCRECRKAFDKNRGRDAAYWRAYRLSRKEVPHG